jgi:hypothetical protein
MILLSVSPVTYSVPLAFSTAELSTADPDGGRYYRSCGWLRAGQGKQPHESASADAVGSPFGSPVADSLRGTYLDRSSAW